MVIAIQGLAGEPTAKRRRRMAPLNTISSASGAKMPMAT